MTLILAQLGTYDFCCGSVGCGLWVATGSSLIPTPSWLVWIFSPAPEHLTFLL